MAAACTGLRPRKLRATGHIEADGGKEAVALRGKVLGRRPFSLSTIVNPQSLSLIDFNSS